MRQKSHRHVSTEEGCCSYPPPPPLRVPASIPATPAPFQVPHAAWRLRGCWGCLRRGSEEHDCPAPPSGRGAGGERVRVFPGLRESDRPPAQSREARATAPLDSFLYVQRVQALRGSALVPGSGEPWPRRQQLGSCASCRPQDGLPPLPPHFASSFPSFRSHKEAIDWEE